MEVLLHLITYLSLLVFVIAVVARFIRIQSYPINLRWEIYPIPHEGARSKHGGSKMEEVDWWEKSHPKSLFHEVVFMLEEMLLLKALYENNRKMWRWSFPFHFGLYLCAAFAGLLGFSVIIELTGALPFTGKTHTHILLKQIKETPRPLRVAVPERDIPGSSAIA